MNGKETCSLIKLTYKNKGLVIYVHTSKNNIEKLQRVDTNTIEQKKVLEIIENKLIKYCKEDEKELATDF